MLKKINLKKVHTQKIAKLKTAKLLHNREIKNLFKTNATMQRQTTRCVIALHALAALMMRSAHRWQVWCKMCMLYSLLPTKKIMIVEFHSKTIKVHIHWKLPIPDLFSTKMSNVKQNFFSNSSITTTTFTLPGKIMIVEFHSGTLKILVIC